MGKDVKIINYGPKGSKEIINLLVNYNSTVENGKPKVFSLKCSLIH